MPKSKPQKCAVPDCPMLGWFPSGLCPWHAPADPDEAA